MQNVGEDLRGRRGPRGQHVRRLRGGRGAWGPRQRLFSNLGLCGSCRAGALWQPPPLSLRWPKCSMAQILQKHFSAIPGCNSSETCG